jgi:hypothetical protein
MILIKDAITSKLENKIDSLRLYLHSNGKTRGLSDPHTIRCSKKLDNFIYKYQLIQITIKNLK